MLFISLNVKPLVSETGLHNLHILTDFIRFHGSLSKSVGHLIYLFIYLFKKALYFQSLRFTLGGDFILPAKVHFWTFAFASKVFHVMAQPEYCWLRADTQ